MHGLSGTPFYVVWDTCNPSPTQLPHRVQVLKRSHTHILTLIHSEWKHWCVCVCVWLNGGLGLLCTSSFSPGRRSCECCSESASHVPAPIANLPPGPRPQSSTKLDWLSPWLFCPPFTRFSLSLFDLTSRRAASNYENFQNELSFCSSPHSSVFESWVRVIKNFVVSPLLNWVPRSRFDSCTNRIVWHMLI